MASIYLHRHGLLGLPYLLPWIPLLLVKRYYWLTVAKPFHGTALVRERFELGGATLRSLHRQRELLCFGCLNTVGLPTPAMPAIENLLRLRLPLQWEIWTARCVYNRSSRRSQIDSRPDSFHMGMLVRYTLAAELTYRYRGLNGHLRNCYTCWYSFYRLSVKFPTLTFVQARYSNYPLVVMQLYCAYRLSSLKHPVSS